MRRVSALAPLTAVIIAAACFDFEDHSFPPSDTGRLIPGGIGSDDAGPPPATATTATATTPDAGAPSVPPEPDAAVSPACTPAPRDCSTAADNDCDGRADDVVDSVCRCGIGSVEPCDEHPGFDGRGSCRAGQRECVGAAGNASSDWGPCVGAIAPQTLDSCDVLGDDASCDGIPNGPPCACVNGDVRSCGPDTEAGLCQFGSTTCVNGQFGACAGEVIPARRNCDSSLDNDCDGRPDDARDTQCRCDPGSTQACNAHAGRDGVGPCRAGTQTCGLGDMGSTSSFAACTGDVAPRTDDCRADGADLDCDGIKGNGTGCTHVVFVYVSTPYACGMAAAEWPFDIFLVAEDDPGGVPNGFSYLTEYRVFVEGDGTKRPVYRCQNPGSNHYLAFQDCPPESAENRLLGYVSTIDGGRGWAELGDFFGQDFGAEVFIRSDVAECCPENCFPLGSYVLQ